MAVQVFPDNPSASMSPRISFSQDLRNDAVPIDHYVQSSSSSSIDFDFCVFRESLDHDSSSADELFSEGKILPIEIRKRLAPPLKSAPPLSPPPPPPPPPPKSAGGGKPSQKTASFWGFKRSASLNCGSGYARTLCPLPVLQRSNSTGSTAAAAAAASVKRSSSNNQKQNIQKSSVPNSALKQPPSTNYQKPPLKKNGYSYNGGAKINPVLNVPSANLFGLGSIFSGGKDKAKKKGLF